MDPLLSLSALIVFLGTPAFLQIALAFAAERWGWFQRQEQKIKTIIFFTAAVAFPMLSWSLTAYVPAAAIASMEPQFRMLVQTIQIAWTWAIGETVHKTDRKIRAIRNGGS